MRNAYKIWSENLKVRDHFEYLGIGGRIILEWILEKHDQKLWTGFMWISTGTSGRILQTQ